MARQIVDIGVEGNDGTGDSIRESFRKVNENFREIYAIFGQGAQIGFTNLNDTPNTYVNNGGKIPLVKPDESGLDFYELVSDAGTNDANDPANSITFTIDNGKLIISAINARLSQDPNPSLGGPLNATNPIAYDTVTQTILTNTGAGLNIDSLALEWNEAHPLAQPITSNNILVSKGYTDQNYVSLTGDTMTGPLVVPANAIGNQVPRRNEVVGKSGDTMTGLLTLSGDPTAELHAATKRYVDNNSFSSTTNFYVSKTGRTYSEMVSDGVPVSKIGRGLAYAFSSVGEACYYAESVIFESSVELGPYKQPITINAGASLAEVDPVPMTNTGTYTRLRISNNAGSHVDQGDPANTDLIPGKVVVGSESGARGLVTNYAGSSGLIDLIDIDMVFDAEISSVSRSSNIATITTSTAHGFSSGTVVVINCSDNTYDALSGVTVTVTSPTTFTYSNTGSNSSTVSATGFTSKGFVAGENVYFDNAVPSEQVTILVESGEYFEDFPIRVPQNTSIVGDELRRVIIKPKDGVSQSPWNKIYFYRDTTVDGLTAATQNYGYHYLTDPTNRSSTAKNNSDIDCFMMNDATSLVHLTVAGHGGFAVVLDPEGQIKTKSPYIQGCTSIAASVNKKAFRGGMYIDGFVSRLPVTLNATYSSASEIVVTGPSAKLSRPFTTTTSILPKMPTSFYVRGDRYQVNNIISVAGGTDGTPATTITLKLASTFSGNSGSTITLETAGNKSVLATHFTQINDLGYGCVAANNALLELVSIFTYYNHTAYYSINGAQIRSVNGSNAHGFYGLKAEGNDPLEVPRPIKLLDDTIQVAKIYKRGIFDSSTYSSTDSSSIVISDYTFIPYSVTEFEVNHTVAGKTAYVSSSVTPVKNTLSIASISRTSNTVTVDTSGNHGFVTGESVVIAGVTGTPSFNGTFTITVTDSNTFTYSQTATNGSGSGGTATLNRKLVRLNMSSGIDGNSARIVEDLTDGDYVVLRSNQNFKFSGDFNAISTRPSTALEFTNDGDDRTYRTISLSTTYYDNTRTPADIEYGTSESVEPNNVISIDSNFNFIDLTPVSSATGGASTIVIGNLSSGDASRVVGFSFGWVDQNVSQKGFIRKIISYVADTPVSGQATITLDSALPSNTVIGIGDTLKAGISKSQSTTLATGISSSGTPATIVLTDSSAFYSSGIIQIDNEYFAYTSNNKATNTLSGITREQLGSIAESHSISASVSEVSSLITTNISTTRATGHDFLNIGTGGYNTSNFPGNIFGEPVELKVDSSSAVDSNGTNPKAEVQEKSKGRVFFASTNQDGFFRVGRFFTVDQGTGTVSFNASIVLSNIDGLGFKRGVTISEFSNDSSMPDLGDAVPTSSAVRSYISRRLGFNDAGAIDINPIGPGTVPRDGHAAMTGNLQMGGFSITNVAAPSSGTDAANKNYVDNKVAERDTLGELSDVTLTTPANGHLLVFTGTGSSTVNASVAGDITVSRSGNTLTASITANSIVNADVNASAGISQSKLALNAASTRANATGITQGDLGVASFNSTEFASTSGWIALANSGIANAKLANSSVTLGSSSVSLGGTITTIAGLTSVSATTFTGNLTGNVTGNVTGTVDTTTNVDVRARNTDAAVHYVTFATSVSGSQRINTDTGFTFTPSTNELNVQGNIIPGANNPTDSGSNLGSATNKWNTVYATVFNGTATQAQYADLAENYLGDAQYEPGTVLIFGGSNEVTVTSIRGDARVAGVVTTNPAHLMNSALEGEFVIGVALQGRVPCKVLGKVQKGDLIVTSAIPGYGIVDNGPRVGTVIGKSISNKTDDGRGVIEVVVGRV
jgi:hypothetical protein